MINEFEKSKVLYCGIFKNAEKKIQEKNGKIFTKKELNTDKTFENAVIEHLLGKTRLGVSPELLSDKTKIKFAMVDIDCNETLNHQEKYQLSQSIQQNLFKDHGLRSIIEQSKSKGFHVFIPFGTEVDRKFVQYVLESAIKKATTIEIRNGSIEIFPKGEKGNAIFLPWFGMFKNEDELDQDFLRNAKTCFVQGENIEPIANQFDAFSQTGTHNLYRVKFLEELYLKFPPCFLKACFNWSDGDRNTLTLGLSGVAKKVARKTEEETIAIIQRIASLNNDEEVSNRISAVKNTYKSENPAGCSILKEGNGSLTLSEPLCHDSCGFNSKKERESKPSNKNEYTPKANISRLLKSGNDIRDLAPLESVVKGLFHKKLVTFIFSEPGVGKTVLCLDIAIQLSYGLPVFEKYLPEKPLRIIYFQGDFPNEVFKERLEKLEKQPHETNFKFVNRYDASEMGLDLSLCSEAGQKNITELIKDFKPDFVVFDTLISFFDGDESRQTDMKGPVDFLRLLTAEYKLSVLVCHHSRKRGTKEKRTALDQSDLIGSSASSRLVSSLLAIVTNKAKSGPDCKVNTVTCVKSWFNELPPFEFAIQTLIVNGEELMNISYFHEDVKLEKISKKEDAKDKILSILESMPNVPLKKEVFQKLLYVSGRTLSTAISELIDDGLIETSGATKNREYFYNPQKKVKEDKPKPDKYRPPEQDII